MTIVAHISDCSPAASLCVVTACPWNLTSAQTPRGRGSRCGRVLVGAPLADQAAALGITPEALLNVQTKAFRKVRRRLTVLGVA